MCAWDKIDFLYWWLSSICLFCINSITGPQLKVVSTMSVGYDHISLPETSKRWQFAYYTVHTLGMLGMLHAGSKSQAWAWVVLSLCCVSGQDTALLQSLMSWIKKKPKPNCVTCVSTENVSSDRLLGNLTEKRQYPVMEKCPMQWRNNTLIMSLHNLF